MRIYDDIGWYVADSEYHEKDILKEAGWIWDPGLRKWRTKDILVAAAVSEHAEPPQDELHAELRLAKEDMDLRLAMSCAPAGTGDGLDAPILLEYLPYQCAGIKYMMDHRNCLLADEMGLGKTIQAIGLWSNTDAESMLVVAPKSLLINWKNEVIKWSTRPVRVATLDSRSRVDESANIVIVNYDIIDRFVEPLKARGFGLMVCDEAHMVKNPRARRTKAVKAVSETAQRKIFLTGTPILNRVSEIWSQLNILWPDKYDNYYKFGNRYCNGRKVSFKVRSKKTGTLINRTRWDFSGSSRLKELQRDLRMLGMVRREKKDVLKSLPPKRRQVICLSPDGISALVDRASVDNLADLQHMTNEGFAELARARKELALAKASDCADHIATMIQGGSGKVIAFAHHREMISELRSLLFDYNPTSIVGGDSKDMRQNALHRFRSDDDCQVILLSIGAGGVGLTLTESSCVVFCELDWTPGAMWQAEDRTHRIGQTADFVLIQYLVVDGTIDAKLANALVAKSNVFKKLTCLSKI